MENKKPHKNSGSSSGPYITLLLICGFVAVLLAVSLMGSAEPSPKKIKIGEFWERLVKNELKTLRFEKNTGKLYVTKRDRFVKAPEKPSESHFFVNIGTSMEAFQSAYLSRLKQMVQSKEISSILSKPPIGVKEPTLLDRFFNLLAQNPILILLALALLAYYVFGNPFEDRKWSSDKGALWNRKKKITTRLKDIQGMAEAKDQLTDIIDILQNPGKYSALGAKLPKGALLSGPPGTGKTLLAKAVAGECNVAFIYSSGSEFDEVYVGVGPQRVRKLFEMARKNAPCIIFIDEIDTVAGRRQSGQNDMEGGDPRTTNQLLTEIDGFDANAGIFVIGSTNRPDMLDPAILRPGRLGRKIYTSLPTINERKSCFRHYVNKIVKLATDVSIDRLADQTSGFSYAGIADVCNEAAMIAARKGCKKVTMAHFDEAIDTCIAGTMVKEKILKGEEREIVAFHEAGHTIVSLNLPKANPLVRVTILPRTRGALGFTQSKSSERYLYQQDYILDQVCILFGGVAAEEIVYGQPSTGAQNDFERAYGQLYNMVAFYGMNDKIGRLSYRSSGEKNWISKPVSEKVAALIDAEVYKLQGILFQKAKNILEERKEELKALADALLKKETLSAKEVEQVLQAARAKKEASQPTLSPSNFVETPSLANQAKNPNK
ncbi:MAG: ATP-dependent metallopeptidase FtsH/Yme1/Tma family protein [Cytophagales bacterium]